MSELGTRVVWVDGDLINVEEAHLSLLTHSLHYAGAVFEGERAYGGRVFKLEAHTKRLLDSARTMHLQHGFGLEDIMEATEAVLRRNGLQDAYVRPLIWRGAESLNITNSALSTHVLIAAVPSLVERASKRLALHLGRWRKPHPQALPPQCKGTGHYSMMIVSQLEAKQAGFDDALLLDHRGYVAEATSSNVFFVQGKRLITPIADTFLNGITRQTILEMASQMGLQSEERHIHLEEIGQFEECFLTGTAAEVKSVECIVDGVRAIRYEASSRTNLLQSAYRQWVAR